MRKTNVLTNKEIYSLLVQGYAVLNTSSLNTYQLNNGSLELSNKVGYTVKNHNEAAIKLSEDVENCNYFVRGERF